DTDDAERRQVMAQVHAFAEQGYRVLAVGEAAMQGDAWPPEQQAFRFRYLGLVAFHDPPKPNIGRVFRSFQEAGIRTVIITGDNAVTARAIAQQVGFITTGEAVNGDEVHALDD